MGKKLIEKTAEAPKEATSAPSVKEPAKPEAPKTAIVKTADKPYVADLSYFTAWAVKFKTSVEKLEIEYQTILNAISEDYKMKKIVKPIKELHDKTRQRLYGTYKKDVKSTAGEMYLRLDAIGEPYDYGAARFQKHLDAFNDNPEKAKKLGLVKIKTDATGKKRTIIPSEEKKQVKDRKTGNMVENKGFGKPLPEHAWIQSMVGMAIPGESYEKNEWNQLRGSMITNSKGLADPTNPKYLCKDLKEGLWYKVKLVNQTDPNDTGMWKLSTSTVTVFEATEGAEIPVSDIPQYYSGLFCEIGGLSEYHNNFRRESEEEIQSKALHKTNCDRFVVTKGNVIDIIPSSDGKENHRIVLDDESLIDQAVPESLNCWMRASKPIKFGKFSDVYVIGKTSQSERKDPATNEYMPGEWGLPSMNAEAFIVIELVDPEVDDDTAAETNPDKEPEGEAVDINAEPKAEDSDSKQSDAEAESKAAEGDGAAAETDAESDASEESTEDAKESDAASTEKKEDW